MLARLVSVPDWDPAAGGQYRVQVLTIALQQLHCITLPPSLLSPQDTISAEINWGQTPLTSAIQIEDQVNWRAAVKLEALTWSLNISILWALSFICPVSCMEGFFVYFWMNYWDTRQWGGAPVLAPEKSLNYHSLPSLPGETISECRMIISRVENFYLWSVAWLEVPADIWEVSEISRL